VEHALAGWIGQETLRFGDEDLGVAEGAFVGELAELIVRGGAEDQVRELGGELVRGEGVAALAVGAAELGAVEEARGL
jgi:hypothetical protein